MPNKVCSYAIARDTKGQQDIPVTHLTGLEKKHTIIKVSRLTFKVLHNQALSYLIDLVAHYHPSRLLRSSSENLLWNPPYNLKTYGGRSFAVAAALLWNPLPQSVKDSTSVDTFKRRPFIQF